VEAFGSGRGRCGFLWSRESRKGSERKDKLSRALHEDGVRGVEPEGRRGAAEAAGQRRRRGRFPPGPPRAEGRRLGPGARRLPGQERRGPAVGSAIAGRRHGNARVGGGAQAQAEGGGTARV